MTGTFFGIKTLPDCPRRAETTTIAFVHAYRAHPALQSERAAPEGRTEPPRITMLNLVASVGSVKSVITNSSSRSSEASPLFPASYG